MYGWRARIGLITPSTNTVNESEFFRHLPEGVSLHTSRMKLEGKADAESVEEMEQYARGCAELVATADVDVVVYGCTVGSLLRGPGHDETLEAELREVARAPVVATTASVRRALNALDADSIALTTPYIDDINRREVEFLEAEGFEVVAESRLGVEESLNLGRQQPTTAYREARAIDHPDADAIFISCADYRTFDVIESLEADLGKPVISSNSAMLWDALTTVGVGHEGIALGTLFDIDR